MNPPVWSGPPEGVVVTANLLYASLVMSLLAGFVAMLGKQWLNRYLRHAGGSVIERCGHRQRKSDALEKWPFRVFIESLLIMLQISLLLLASGLSRYMWSVNVSVARLITSFTAFGVIYYLGILAVGTSSYECPFRTPAMMALLYFRDSMLKLSATLPTPSSIYTTSRDLPSRIISGIHKAITEATTSLLRWLDRAFQNTKRALIRVVGMFGPVEVLPTTVGDLTLMPATARPPTVEDVALVPATVLPATVGDVAPVSVAVLSTAVEDVTPVPEKSAGLRVHVWNLENVQRQNADNACCICWFLLNITDPGAIGSAIRLPGTIRWFGGGSDNNPPFHLILPIFKACFDSTKQPYPAMRDRAYFSARAILQINTRARTQSCERAFKYHIPADSSSSSQCTDSDLRHILHMLELNHNSDRPTFAFPSGDTNTHAHLLWMSNSLVDSTRAGPNLTLESY